MQYKLFLALVSIAGTISEVPAQVKDSVQLAEVTINGTHTVTKGDMTLFYPADHQKNSSTNGYDLLARTGIPSLRIDAVTHSITALNDKGDIQIRLNGILCGKAELMALDPKSVKRIEFTDNPGVRYGSSIGYVLNIVTQRTEEGYAIGIDTGNSVTTTNGNVFTFGKVNKDIHEWGLSYNFDYKNLKGTLQNEVSDYLLSNGSIKTISRNDIDSHRKDANHGLQLFYNATKEERYVFQAKFDGSLQNSPINERHILINNKTLTTSTETEHTWSPAIDLYWQQFLKNKQTLTANIVGTYNYTRGDNFSDEGSPYAYSVKGKNYSLMSEVIYEKKVRPFTLSTGIRYNLKIIDNDYSGDAVANDITHRSTTYIFGQLNGSIGKLSYQGGLGYSFLYFHQGDYNYHFNMFRPKAMLSYQFSKGWNLSYSVELNQHVSQIAMINNVRIRQNSMEWKEGNPNIHPNKRIEQFLQLSYNRPGFSTRLSGCYRINRNANMDHYTRETDTAGNDFYVYTQLNQKGVNMLYITNDFLWDIIPEKLSLNGQGGIYRFFNRGNDYSHYYTTFNGGITLTAYLKAWTISAYTDNGWNFMEGENHGSNGAATYLAISYRTGNFTFSAYWQHPFENTPRFYKSEVMNRYVHKLSSMISRDYGNMVSIGITWKLNKGRQYKSAQRQIEYKDKESGILK